MADQDRHVLEKLSPKQRQFFTLGGIALLLFGVLWAVFSITDTPKQPGAQTSATPGQRKVTNLGVRRRGELDPREKWIGEAGKDVAQLKQDRDQARSQIANQERFNQEIMNRFDALKQDLARAPQAPPAPASLPAGTSPAYPPTGRPACRVVERRLPAAPTSPRRQLAGGSPTAPSMLYEAPPIGLVRVTLAETSKPGGRLPNVAGGAVPRSDEAAKAKSVDNYLPVVYPRVLLGGLDAPTGGQSQTNPHPVLLRLVDSAVLPNHYGRRSA